MRRLDHFIAVLGVVLLAFVIAFGSIDRAAAQQSISLESSGLPNLVGIGVGLVPDYEGSNDYTIGVGPTGRLGFWGERYVQLVATELTVNVVDHPYWRFGPVANVHLGRKDVDDSVVDSMADIDHTVELGLFAGVDFTNEVNERIRFGSEIEFVHDVGGVSDGWRAEWSARYWHPLAEWLDFGIVGGVTYGSGNFMDTYFGVNMSDAARSGLPTFSADSGFKDVRVTPILLFHFSRSWHLGTGIMYKRLLGDAADSPVVDGRGDENQFLVATSLIYSW